MNVLTVAVPEEIAQKYADQILDYRELVRIVEEGMWVDTPLQDPILMEDFLSQLKNTKDGEILDQDHQ